jgi:phage virion morphogenesis protein
MLDGKLVVDDREVRQALERARQKLADLRPLLREIAGRLHDAVEENFRLEGRRGGRPRWAELKPATQRARATAGHWPGRILQRRGQLAASVEPGWSRDKAWVGTNLRYAAIHQFGGTIEKKARTQVLAYDEGTGRFLSRRRAGRRKKGFTAVRFAAIGAHEVTMPPRPFLAIGPEDLADVAGIARRYLAA